MKPDSNIKCNCGHLQKKHFKNEGCCKHCGCTWYHPNDACIIEQKKKK